VNPKQGCSLFIGASLAGEVTRAILVSHGSGFSRPNFTVHHTFLFQATKFSCSLSETRACISQLSVCSFSSFAQFPLLSVSAHAWLDRRNMTLLLEEGMLPDKPHDQWGLIIWDTTTFHRDPGVVQMLKERRWHVEMIGGGITDHIQVLVRAVSHVFYFFAKPHPFHFYFIRSFL
jgi:hypothetical protein